MLTARKHCMLTAGLIACCPPHCTQVLYSPHVYGPSVATQPYFGARDFPRNLRAIWAEQWGHLTVGPSASESVGILIGEWGGRLESSEKEATWQHELAHFIADPASRLAGSFCERIARHGQPSARNRSLVGQSAQQSSGRR